MNLGSVLALEAAKKKKHVVVPSSVRSRYNRAAADRVAGIVHKALVHGSWASLQNKLAPILADVAATSGKLIQDEFGVTGKGFKLKAAANAWGQGRARELVGLISQATNRAMRGEDRALDPEYAVSFERAQKIATMEVGKARVAGAVQGAAVSGHAIQKEWVVSTDHVEEDECDDNEDDGPIPVGEAFSSGDFEPPAHVNCQCSIALVG